MDSPEKLSLDSSAIAELRDAATKPDALQELLQKQGVTASTERQTLSSYVPGPLAPAEYLRILAGGKEAMPILDVSPYPQMRVSASSLIRLVVGGKIPLSWSEKYKQLSPFGGGTAYTSQEAAALLSKGGGKIENAKEQDIRASDIPSSCVPEIATWFMTGSDREDAVGSAERELLEELVDECKVASAEEVAKISKPTLMGYGTKLAPDAKGRQTLYLVEICEAVVPQDLVQEFTERIGNMSDVALVTEEEIRAGRTADGRSIEPLSHFLVHPLPSLPEIKGQ